MALVCKLVATGIGLVVDTALQVVLSSLSPGLLIQKEVELADLKSKFAEAMAFLPSHPSSFATTAGTTSLALHYSPAFVISSTGGGGSNDVLSKSSLNPAASDYTPKITQWNGHHACTAIDILHNLYQMSMCVVSRTHAGQWKKFCWQYLYSCLV